MTNRLLLKQGAMFGLDARIALAIFGALSVISGAALFSAIEKADLTKKSQFFIEIGKATESFYLDTGVVPESSGPVKSCAMVEPGVHGAKVPYFDSGLIKEHPYRECNSATDPTLYLNDPIYYTLSRFGKNAERPWIYYSKMTNNSWDQTASFLEPAQACTDSNCGLYYILWMELSDYNSKVGNAVVSKLKQLDVLIDGTVSPSDGRLRYPDQYPTKNAQLSYAYQLIPLVPR